MATLGAEQTPLVVYAALFFAILMMLGVAVMYVRWYIADQKYERKQPVFDDNDVELVPMNNNNGVPAPAAANNDEH
jgi:hypothetical protein